MRCGAPLALLAFAACPSSPSFYTGLPSPPFEGVWTADDTPRPIGIVVYETPDGDSWSAHGLAFTGSGAYLTHDCRDFRVDPVSGTVTAAVGIARLGSVADMGKLEWPSTSRGLVLRRALVAGRTFAYPCSSCSTEEDVVLDAGIERQSPDSVLFHAEVSWVLTTSLSDGGSSVDTVVDSQLLVLRRRLSCP